LAETVSPPVTASLPEASTRTARPAGPLKRWLLQGHPNHTEGPYEPDAKGHHQHPWWKVMCLTGVDYFSTLGYQPGIAALAAGALSPFATLILVLLTLFGALPMYKRVAEESPHGDGSISMLENLLSRWKGKLLVLCLIGFVATGFVITITLSAADATAHIVENPFIHRYIEGYSHSQEVWLSIGVTLVLITLLGAVFLKGFQEAIGIAVAIVVIYISLNLALIGRCLYEIVQHPEYLPRWQDALYAKHSNPLMMIAAASLLFPSWPWGYRVSRRALWSCRW
jgi:hypothetical protein